MTAIRNFLLATSKNLNLEPILAKAKEREGQKAQALTQSQRQRIADRLDDAAARVVARGFLMKQRLSCEL